MKNINLTNVEELNSNDVQSLNGGTLTTYLVVAAVSYYYEVKGAFETLKKMI